MSLSKIPHELTSKIASYLTMADSNRLAATCRSIYKSCHISVRKVTENIIREDIEEAD